MFHIDEEFLHPNIPVTIRFTPVLYEWLCEIQKREDLSFNRVVLQCCKNAMDEDRLTQSESNTRIDGGQNHYHVLDEG